MATYTATFRGSATWANSFSARASGLASLYRTAAARLQGNAYLLQACSVRSRGLGRLANDALERFEFHAGIDANPFTADALVNQLTSHSPALIYQFTETDTADPVADESTLANHGTYHGDVTPGSPGPPTLSPSYAAAFDGSTGYVSAGLLSGAGVGNLTGAAMAAGVWFSAWVRLRSTSDAIRLAGTLNTDTATAWFIRPNFDNAGNAPGYVYAFLRDESAGILSGSADLGLDDEDWHHVTIGIDPATTSIVMTVDGEARSVTLLYDSMSTTPTLANFGYPVIFEAWNNHGTIEAHADCDLAHVALGAGVWNVPAALRVWRVGMGLAIDTAAPGAMPATVQLTAAPADCQRTWHVVTRRRNRWGLASANAQAWQVTVDDTGAQVLTPPTAPEWVSIDAAAGGTGRVMASYLYTADAAADRADTWAIWWAIDADPDPTIDEPDALVAMAFSDGQAKLDTLTDAAADGQEIRVLVRTRRTIDAELETVIDSTNTTVTTATAATAGPVTGESGRWAWFGQAAAQQR